MSDVFFGIDSRRFLSRSYDPVAAGESSNGFFTRRIGSCMQERCGRRNLPVLASIPGDPPRLRARDRITTICGPSAIAQSVEQLTVNQRVAGSSPASGAMKRKSPRKREGSFASPHARHDSSVRRPGRCRNPPKTAEKSLALHSRTIVLISGRLVNPSSIPAHKWHLLLLPESDAAILAIRRPNG